MQVTGCAGWWTSCPCDSCDIAKLHVNKFVSHDVACPCSCDAFSAAMVVCIWSILEDSGSHGKCMTCTLYCIVVLVVPLGIVNQTI